MPALAVVFTRRAARQVEAAALWWKANRPAAPNALHDELAAALTLVADQPACGALVPSRVSKGVRRIHLARVDYHVYYRLAVQVIALWHARRGSQPSL